MLGMFQTIIGHGVKAADLNTVQVCVRAVIIFVFTVAMARLASRRFLSDMTAFDVILGIMMGSILSRSINGPSPMVPTMVGAFSLVVLHRIIGILAFNQTWFAVLVKGRPVTLVENGESVSDALRRNHISDEDILQALRTEGGVSDLKNALKVTLERSGKISVVTSS